MAPKKVNQAIGGIMTLVALFFLYKFVESIRSGGSGWCDLCYITFGMNAATVAGLGWTNKLIPDDKKKK